VIVATTTALDPELIFGAAKWNLAEAAKRGDFG
jgi:hypothetical protein